jgi:hypothetical protein
VSLAAELQRAAAFEPELLAACPAPERGAATLSGLALVMSAGISGTASALAAYELVGMDVRVLGFGAWSAWTYLMLTRFLLASRRRSCVACGTVHPPRLLAWCTRAGLSALFAAFGAVLLGAAILSLRHGTPLSLGMRSAARSPVSLVLVVLPVVALALLPLAIEAWWRRAPTLEYARRRAAIDRALLARSDARLAATGLRVPARMSRCPHERIGCEPPEAR